MNKSSSKQQKLTVPKGATSLVARYCGDAPVTKKSFNEQVVSKVLYSASKPRQK